MDNFFTYGFPICGVGMGIFILFTAAYLYFHSRHMDEWQLTRGRILKSQIKRNGMAYSPVVYFRYEVQGIEHIGSSININGMQSYKQKVAQEWIAPYPVGKEVDVFYNPLRPKMAVLEKSISIGALVTVIVGGIFLIAIGVFYFIVEFV